MSWDISFMAADNPPPPVAEMPEDWTGNHAEPAVDVRARISSVRPETDWSDPTWGRLDGDGFSLEFNMGDDDPCSDFMVHVHGGGDVVRLIEEIALLPGWYALDISQGEWLHHCGSVEAGKIAFDDYLDQIVTEVQGEKAQPGLLSRFRSLFRIGKAED